MINEDIARIIAAHTVNAGGVKNKWRYINHETLIDALADAMEAAVCPKCEATDWEDNYCVNNGCGYSREPFDRQEWTRIAKGG